MQPGRSTAQNLFMPRRHSQTVMCSHAMKARLFAPHWRAINKHAPGGVNLFFLLLQHFKMRLLTIVDVSSIAVGVDERIGSAVCLQPGIFAFHPVITSVRPQENIAW